MYFGSNKPDTMTAQTRAGPLRLVTAQVVVMETAPQSRCTHKHCITQCISVEPPSSSLRPSPLLVFLSAPSCLTLALQRKRYWSKRFSSNNCREVFLQLYKEGFNKESLCSGVDLSVKWWETGSRVFNKGDRVTGYSRRSWSDRHTRREKEGKD